MDRLNIPEDMPIESKLVSRQIKSAQTQIEGQNAEVRKNVLKYDEVLNQQRQVIYGERKRVLNGEDLHEQVRHMLDDVVGEYVTGATSEGYAEDWDLDQLWSSLKQLYPIGVTIEDVLEEVGGEKPKLDADLLRTRLTEDAHAAYARREEELSPPAMREIERQVLLSVIDRKWREHLYEMDYLKEGVGLRAYAQRNPVVEYQREGFAMFQSMLDGIKEEAVGYLFHADVQVRESPAGQPARPGVPLPVAQAPVEIRAKGLGGGLPQPSSLQYSAPTIDGAAGSGGVTVEREQDRGGTALGVGRGPQQGAGPQIGRTAPGGGAGSGSGSGAGSGGPGTGRGPGRPGPRPRPAGSRQQAPGQVVGSGPSRNAPCPCGSGKKYKRCHGAPAGGGPA
jgi:preprotein translocase subunit SecA